jgi:chemotaxis methyl-accepting protein methylase
MSTTTRFFRNYPQLVTVAETVGTVWEPGSTLDVLHIGGSIGCEALSFMIVMEECEPSFELRVVSTDVDVQVLEYGRGFAYDEEMFAPILGEGGAPPELLAKWFAADGARGRRVRVPDPRVSRRLSFAPLDISAPQAGRSADIVFCQNVLIHMSRALAERCLRNVLGLLRSPAVLVCGGMDLGLRSTLRGAGLRPIADRIREIHEAWASHRFHFRNDRGRYYFELEDLDEARTDWVTRYSSIFVKDRACA